MIYWDPNPDVFTIPLIKWPIKWYGVLFALGFALGFSLFKGILNRYFLQNPEAPNPACPLNLEEASSHIAPEKVRKFAEIAAACHSPDPKKTVALLCWEEKFGDAITSIRKKAAWIADQTTLYMVIATVIGARLGHFFFYERPAEYLRHPFEIFKLREGGLASHGAVIAILLAVWLLSKRTQKLDSELSPLRLLDFICVPTALAAVFIRLGNFINQEIPGTATTLPWGVVFGHPLDGTEPIARHPAQLYEAFFYLMVFAVLWRLTFYPAFSLVKGRLIGLFFVLVFGFRFFVEFFKLEQSRLPSMQTSFLTMGQWLSLPLLIAGIILLLPAAKRTQLWQFLTRAKKQDRA